MVIDYECRGVRGKNKIGSLGEKTWRPVIIQPPKKEGVGKNFGCVTINLLNP